jgi:hypothetical protein
VTGTASTNAFSGSLEAEGVTDITLTQNFTHEECTHLNGQSDSDSWSGTGTVSGTFDGDAFGTLTTAWKVDDITIAGSWSGPVVVTEP